LKDTAKVSDDDLAMEVRQLRALVEQYAEEIARLRADARQVRVDNGIAANARLTPEDYAFARQMAMAGQKPSGRLRA
jgi:outer membrane murein-binding lipoprotein Lpp